MSVDRSLLIRYLRQLGERGERELMLESLTAEEAVALLRGVSAEGARRGGGQEASAAVASSEGEAPAGGGASSRTLDVLREEAMGCTKCRLHEDRQSVVFGEGGHDADVVVVGEAPGKQEDRTGRPFVGPAGKLLDMLLLSVGLPRKRVFICNVLKCRPPKNRDPRPDEVECCSPYLHRQLEIISPTVLLTVGRFAAQALSGSEESIGRLRGRVHSYRGIPLVASYHPAYLLRSPSQVQRTWEDFQLMRQVLDERA